MTIPYEDLKSLNESFYTEFQRDFADTLASGWFILGKKVERFEKEFAQYCGAKHCVGVASGLDALMLSLKIFDFAPGSEVLVPSNTYIATILAIMQCHLVPVLVEPDINTYNLDPTQLKSKLTSKTVAIMPVHLYGKVCDMGSIGSFAKEHGLKIVEDCAQAHGAKFRGKMAGTFGECGAFSFYPTKNLGALGDSGAVLTDSDDIAAQLRMLRNYGSTVKYYNEIVGFNSRLDEVQAGFLSIKLKKLDDINLHKRKLADLYFKNLSDKFIKPVRHNDYFDVYHIFNIRHPKRDRLREYLLEKDIKTEIHYPVPPHEQKAMKSVLENCRFPISTEIHATTLSLPISYCHTESQIMTVIDALNRFE